MIGPQCLDVLAIDCDSPIRQSSQRVQHQPAHLPVGTLEPLTGTRAPFPQSRTAVGEEHALGSDRALFAQRAFRRADHRAQFHDALIPHHGWPVESTTSCSGILRQHLVRQRTFRRACRPSSRLGAEEHPREHTSNIGIDHGDPLTIGEAHHRAGRIVADPRQGDQLVVGTRQIVMAIVRHHSRAFLQTQGPARVAETTPGGDHIGFGRIRECGRIRPTFHPCLPIRHDATHLGLLAHHFGDEHAPRRGPSESPRQIAGGFMPPFGKRFGHHTGISVMSVFRHGGHGFG